jgi:hypothetical protein
VQALRDKADSVLAEWYPGILRLGRQQGGLFLALRSKAKPRVDRHAQIAKFSCKMIIDSKGLLGISRCRTEFYELVLSHY